MPPSAAIAPNAVLRLGTYRSIWDAPEVEASPALQYVGSASATSSCRRPTRAARPAPRRRSSSPSRDDGVSESTEATVALREAVPAGSAFLAGNARRRARPRRSASAPDARHRRLLRALVRPDHQGHRDLPRRPAAGAARARRRAQGARPDAEPLRAQPRRPVRRAAAAGRHHQAADEGAVPPAYVDRLSVHRRADHLGADRRGGVRADPVR